MTMRSKSGSRTNAARLARRALRLGSGWMAAGILAFGVYRVYKWAEPSAQSLAAVLSPAPASSINLELEDADFENFAGGAKNWSLKAGRILLERMGGSAANSLQSADIENIREGRLFAMPEAGGRGGANAFSPFASSQAHGSDTPPSNAPASDANTAQTSTTQTNAAMTQASADAGAGPITATFSAQHGRYTVGVTDGLPPDLLLTYSVQWQFRLTGDVKIRTREGYELNAPTIVIMELFNRRTSKAERQMLCEQGATVRAKGASMQANQARYNDASQTVECLGGMRGTLQKDTIQAERCYWSFKDNTIRCPDAVSGVWQDTRYTAQDVTIDVSRHIYTGKKMTMQLSGNAASKMAMVSLGLVMASGVVSKGQQPPPPKFGNMKFDGRFHSQSGISDGQEFTYTAGSRVITGDNAHYDQNKGILDASGHLVMDDPENHVTGQKAHVDEKAGLATLNGNVVLISKPNKAAPAPDEPGRADVAGAKNQGAIITCDQVDSLYRKKYTYLHGHVAFKQSILRPGKPPLERTGTAGHAEYDAKKEILYLFPPVEGHDSENGEFHAKDNKVTIGTSPGKEYIEGVSGVIRFPIQESTPEDDNAPPVAPPFTGDDAPKPAAKPDTTIPAAKPDTTVPPAKNRMRRRKSRKRRQPP